MANTYVNIASTTLGTNQASVTFSSISSAYTDLVIKYSARSTDTTVQYATLEINANTNTVYSYTILFASSGTVTSIRDSNLSEIIYNYQTNSNQTSSTFGSGEIYIPSYCSSTNKPLFSFSAQEDNVASGPRMGTVAGLFRSTTAITSLKLYSQASTNFASGSSFYLYGIKNS